MRQLLTRSGKQVTIGTGTGTKWQWAKKSTDHLVYRPIVDQLTKALSFGFNHIDTADAYTTCPEVGQAIKESGIKREDLWITTKYAPFIIKGRRAPETITEAFNIMLKELDTDYVDACLIHSPFIDPSYNYTLTSLWQELIEIAKSGKIRYIGASNFSVQHLQQVSALDDEFKPVINQIEFHPNLQSQSPGILEYCAEHDILVEGYNPLCSLFKFKDESLSAYLEELSSKYGKTDSQILLKWVTHRGVLPITTSSNDERIKQSLDLTFQLTNEEIAKISEIGNATKARFFFEQYDKPPY